MTAFNLWLPSGISLSRRRTGGTPTPTPTPAPIPDNNNLLFFGDSRVSGSFSTTGITGTSRQILRGVDFCGNLASFDPRWENYFADWVNSDGTVTLGNFGVSGQRTDNYTANPRPTNPERSYIHAGNHPAAVIVVLGALNNFKASNNIAGAAADIATLVDYWSNPANTGGVQKIVVLVDETPVGMNNAGTEANGISVSSDALAMRTYAETIRGYDYLQPGGKPYCVVAPVYESFLDPASISSGTFRYRNYRGLSGDGTHGSSLRGALIGAAIKDALDGVATSAGFTDGVSPLLASAANLNWIGQGITPASNVHNPRLLGTAGSVSGTNVSLSGTLPTGWVAQLTGSVTSLSITASTVTNANGENELVLALTWAGGASNPSILFRNNISSANLGSFVRGETAQMVALCKVDAGSDNLAGMGLYLATISTTTSENYTARNYADASKGALKLAAYGGSFDGGGRQMYLKTPPCPTAGVSAFGSPALQPAVSIQLGNGSGSATVRIAQPTVFEL